jgi:hypothetical protein
VINDGDGVLFFGTSESVFSGFPVGKEVRSELWTAGEG